MIHFKNRFLQLIISLIDIVHELIRSLGCIYRSGNGNVFCMLRYHDRLVSFQVMM